MMGEESSKKKSWSVTIMIILGMLWFHHTFTSQRDSMRREFDRITDMVRKVEDRIIDVERKVDKIMQQKESQVQQSKIAKLAD